ncbi:hypothetical protein HMPREF1866_01523 [Lachnoanaerobaculum saburreum]|uniref:Transposase DDE domain-containing protein n=1 Tax=Lachnoanaerobaculum saburreum TaxID=467210 RepID=A0A133ZPC1_9FIRM|nr:hypothetical protein HMPREF1866_01523 [Lachnoanaerobaculum saburreum]
MTENFIKESKTGFDFASVSSYTRIVNANRLQIHALAYNIFNWFRRLALSANMDCSFCQKFSLAFLSPISEK